MAVNMNADMMKCYMMRMYEVRPEHRDMWRREFPKCRMLWERHGATCMGQWQVCLGGSCMSMMMLQFPNSMAAMQCQMEVRADPDYVEICRMCLNCIDNIHCPLMKCMPIMPMCMPTPKCNIIMMRYTLRSLPCMAMKDCQMYIQKMMERICKPCGMRMLGCYTPCYDRDCNEIYIMLEMPENSVTACMTKMDEYSMMNCMDAGWCESVMPFYNHCNGYSMQMMNYCM